MRRSLVGLLVGVALVVAAIWLFRHLSHQDHGDTRPGATAPAARRDLQPARTSAPGPAAPTSQPAPRPKLSPAARAQLLAALARAQQARGAGPAPSAAPPPGTGGPRPAGGADGGVRGSLDKEYIRAAVRELVPLVRECYEHALRDQPDLGGKLTVEFAIAGEPEIGGVVTESRIAGTDAGVLHAGLEECVRETMYGLQLDAPAGGGTVTVRYPFVFRTQ
jgi:hypothetical protein